ncbi:hypothetical protein HK097_001065 [Rhizophlyctis rosea]|uniref:Uncharacterized protein n=1 Tax=Rhizophlyctis rosea TaxID=64517 RepID=A0AAD5WZ53_9FUNG|nr:hypothetical protein HK097_001065 [Rhizophlyctis rosea]
MAASFLASTAVAISFGLIAFLSTVGGRAEATTAENPIGHNFGFLLDRYFGYKIVIILIMFMSSFFCFAQSIRFFNHVGFVINGSYAPPTLFSPILNPTLNHRLSPPVYITQEELSSLIPPEYSLTVLTPSAVGHILNRGNYFYTLGMRGFYVSFPLIAWLWGPAFLGVASVLMCALLRVIDFNTKGLMGEQKKSAEEMSVSTLPV